MSNEKMSEQTKKNISKTGFFLALACCFIALCIGTVTTVRNFKDEKARIESAEDVENNVDNIPATQAREDYISTNPTTKEEAEMTVAATTAEPATEEITAKYILPIDNTVTNGFSNGELIYSETMRDYRVHNGIDISAQSGEEVKSFSKSKIVKIYKDDLYGDAIVADLGDNLTAYYFGVMANPDISEGSDVTAGQVIGKVSSVLCESAEESHIHFAVQKGEDFIDPLTIIG
jgi:murein DD-endopeptidase MepM/ murein hydrolase activator NlpD